MVKVLAVVPSGTCFGLQDVTLSFFSCLSHRSNAFFLLTRWSDGEFARRLDRLSIPYDYSWLGMFSRRMDWRNLKMTLHCAAKLPWLYRDYFKILRKFKPDLIYTANHHELVLLLPLLKLFGIPVVCHIHDPPPAAPFYRGVFRLAGAPVTRFVAVSESVMSRTAALGIDAAKIVCLHNGIDLDEFPFRESRTRRFEEDYGWDAQSVILGITGQILEEKGHGDLVVAVRMALNRNPSIRLVIGGRQLGTYFETLRRQIDDAGLSNVIRFSGWQASASDFFAAVDILVLPSRHDEGFGLVVAQAMAMGLPVIATASGGAKEVVMNGRTGLIVNKADPLALAEAVCSLAASAELRKEIGLEGRKRIERHFDIKEQARQFEMLLTGVAAN